MIKENVDRQLTFFVEDREGINDGVRRCPPDQILFYPIHRLYDNQLTAWLGYPDGFGQRLQREVAMVEDRAEHDVIKSI